mmetsp:Transcript_46251/g.108522  ORF Transcript_46251/g.108522 Transcript_46251/m.108522 type:complete len:211 (+) Transcript_46251:771-1403(+)
MGVRDYDTSMDVWSVGCIVAELLLRKPLFPGRDSLEIIKMQVNKCGSPSLAEQTPFSHRARQFLATLGEVPPVQWSEALGSASVENVSAAMTGLVGKLLHFSAPRRVSAAQALSHRALAAIHDPSDEPLCSRPLPAHVRAAPPDNLPLRDMLLAEIQECQAPAPVNPPAAIPPPPDNPPSPPPDGEREGETWTDDAREGTGESLSGLMIE